METNDQFCERIEREQRLAARLRLATERLEEAQRGKIWAVVEAHQSGLSIRQIAAATGLSSSRVHQLLGSEESREIPRWLSQQREQEAAPSKDHPNLRARLAGELESLRRCREWLERLERGEKVVVNLRPETDPETDYPTWTDWPASRRSPRRKSRREEPRPGALATGDGWRSPTRRRND
jgi:AraC-like DNA-binding protein